MAATIKGCSVLEECRGAGRLRGTPVRLIWWEQCLDPPEETEVEVQERTERVTAARRTWCLPAPQVLYGPMSEEDTEADRRRWAAAYVPDYPAEDYTYTPPAPTRRPPPPPPSPLPPARRAAATCNNKKDRDVGGGGDRGGEEAVGGQGGRHSSARAGTVARGCRCRCCEGKGRSGGGKLGALRAPPPPRPTLPLLHVVGGISD